MIQARQKKSTSEIIIMMEIAIIHPMIRIRMEDSVEMMNIEYIFSFKRMQKLTTELGFSAPGKSISIIISRIIIITGPGHRLQVMAVFWNFSENLIRASKFGVIIKLHPEPGRRLGSSLTPQPRGITRDQTYIHARLAKGYQDMCRYHIDTAGNPVIYFSASSLVCLTDRASR